MCMRLVFVEKFPFTGTLDRNKEYQCILFFIPFADLFGFRLRVECAFVFIRIILVYPE